MLAKFRELEIHDAILVMDNVRFHHNSGVKALIEGAGHNLLFLPPHSPFLNPIENAFNQWKNLVKCSQPTNEAELLTSIHESWRAITTTQCRNYYDNMESFIPRCLRGEEIDG